MSWPVYDPDYDEVAVEHDDEGEDERHHHHEEEVEKFIQGGVEASNGCALPVFRHQRMTTKIEEETLKRIMRLHSSTSTLCPTWGREQRGANIQAMTNIFLVFLESDLWEIGETTADSLKGQTCLKVELREWERKKYIL